MIFDGELGYTYVIRMPKVSWAGVLWSFRAGRAAAGTLVDMRESGWRRPRCSLICGVRISQ